MTGINIFNNIAVIELLLLQIYFYFILFFETNLINKNNSLLYNRLILEKDTHIYYIQKLVTYEIFFILPALNFVVLIHNL